MHKWQQTVMISDQMPLIKEELIMALRKDPKNKNIFTHIPYSID
jgi:hypothetical protein